MLVWGYQATGTQLSLEGPPPPAFSWGDFGAGLNISNITVQQYRNTDGSAGGPIIVLNTHILDVDPDPHETDPLVPCFGGKQCEDIGISTFQYALWLGSTGGAGGAVNRVGAAFFGGFRLTDLDDVGMNFSFLQIFTDNANPAGTIDGGGFRGKVNGDIPGFNANPANPAAGWNFAGNDVQFDYFDVPFDSSTTVETVSFETALVNYEGNIADILAGFTWSFTSDGAGGVSGMSVTQQAAASNRLLGLYRAANPLVTYQNVGEGSSHALVPEPTPFCLVGGVLILLGLGWRRKGVTHRLDSSECRRYCD
jgi:hypothetical protein